MAKKTQSPKFETVKVTPAMATTWLENNPMNRPIRTNWVSYLAREMDAGRWMLNGETIAFAPTGELLNGQHRLRAVINCGKPIEMTVARDVDPESFKTMDTGMKRSSGQIFGLNGINNAAICAGMCRWILMLQLKSTDMGRTYSAQEQLLTFESHPLVSKYAKALTHKSLRDFLPASCGAALVLAAEKYGEDVVDMFLYHFQTGEDLKRGSAVYELRERLIRNRGAAAKLTQLAKVAMTIKALKAFAKGNALYTLRYSPEEAFPTI